MASLFGAPAEPQFIPAALPPAPPVVTPPPVMPVPDDERLKEKKKISMQQGMAARGRQSTLLSNDVGSTDHLGG